MKVNKKWWLPAALLLKAVAIHFYSASAERVETGYSRHFYPAISLVFRYLFGWLPFSAGDILYTIAGVYLIKKIVDGVRAIRQKRVTRYSLLVTARKFAVALLWIYVLFNVFWGINYNRQGIAGQLGLSLSPYNQAELLQVNQLLLEKVNGAKQLIVQQGIGYPSHRELFSEVQANYQRLSATYPFLKYNPSSLKSSFWGWLGNYTGFTGYYNPFSGEAQVNTTVPTFLQPFTACHEVGHQLGYAKEMEANFVGYLAASTSPDPLFRYSVYLDMFLYSNRNLAHMDSTDASGIRRQLLPQVKEDLDTWRRFNLQHKNPVEPVIRWMYGKYLQSNQQPQGVLSYDEVTGFLIAYYKKFGAI